MMGFLTSVVAFVFVLGVLVVLHEAGHFLMARAVGARVEVFSVGFGRRLWGFRRGETDYRISVIPLGGYVRICGLGPDESTVVGSSEVDENLLARWKRALILFAGPFTNALAAVFFLWFAFMLGIEVPYYQDDPAVVGWVDPTSSAAEAGMDVGDHVISVDGVAMESWRDLEMSLFTAGDQEVEVLLERGSENLTVHLTPESVGRYGIGYSGILPPLEPVVQGLIGGAPAQRAGIEVGDRIIAVNGDPVEQFYDLIRLISPHPEEEIDLTVIRDGQTRSIKVTTREDGGEGKIGIPVIQPTEMRKLGVGAAFETAYYETLRMTVETFRVIGRLLTARTSVRQVSGPIEIARISGEAARSGMRTLIWFLGVISLQLGIFNLLPIPVLDGGHLTIIGFESIIRRDLSLRIKERILEVGFYLLMALVVVILANDMLKQDMIANLIERIFG
jgi:regulator of sigma E protease